MLHRPLYRVKLVKCILFLTLKFTGIWLLIELWFRTLFPSSRQARQQSTFPPLDDIQVVDYFGSQRAKQTLLVC